MAKKLSFGNNNLGSKAIFEQRKRYFQVFEPHLEGEPRDRIDFWYDKNFYGKVNRYGTAVYPSERGHNLIQLAGTKEMILALDFVASAYADFRKTIKKAISLGQVQETAFIKGVLKPKKGWVSVHATYHDHMKSMYDAFANTYVLEHQRLEEIVDFSSFIGVFTDWVKRVTPDSPLTRTGFVLSPYCENNISGLMIDITTDDYSDDLIKSYMLMDTGFDCYQTTAHKFGFMIDRNAPWRMVADLDSTAMKEYMGKVGNASDADIFESYFYRSHNYDVIALKAYLKSFYDSFVGTYPVVRKYYNTNCNRIHFPNHMSTMTLPNKTKLKVEERQRMSQQEYEATYGDLWWVKFYYFLRKEELDMPMNDVQCQHAYLEAQKICKRLDFNAAVAYINRQTTYIMKSNFQNMRDRYKSSIQSGYFTPVPISKKGIQETTAALIAYS